ncbi:MAG: zinc ribbon domain-containing protein [Proteobacteria bacterium]|nr:zinc ribbon domain-containing protein [Pseudomonadota bacterium]
MIRHLLVAFFFVSFFVPATVLSADRYDGNWNMISMSISVQVKSWGKHCGPRPGSYSSNKSRPVEIVAKGPHLIFSRGGTRTDRCGSPNPRLSTISQNIEPGTWQRVCKTSKKDPKFEKGQYRLVAENTRRLIYTAVSHFDWTLKGDHCIATSDEKRIYVRAKAGKKEEKTATISKAPPATDPAAKPDCEQTGAIKKLTVLPHTTRIGPGQGTCFKAIGIDEAGCRFPVDAKWTAAQNNKIVPGLVTQKGCFRAGKTAADAEGRYRITAKVGDKSDSAKITVVYPDLGELFAARLKPLEDGEEEKPQTTTQTPPSPPVIIKPATTSNSPGTFDVSTLLVPAILIAILGLAVVVVLIVLRNRLAEIGGTEKWQVCPTCGMKLPKDALFCPNDSTSLAPEKTESESEVGYPPSLSNTGMVCPACHRGYDPDAKFCPHDSEVLIPYPEWRKLNRT